MILSIPDVRSISHRISLYKCGSYTSCQREPSCAEIEAWHLPAFGQLWEQQVQDEIQRQVFRSFPQHFCPAIAQAQSVGQVECPRTGDYVYLYSSMTTLDVRTTLQ